MRLETALFSSREGISAHGQAIAVVGDNISNANTIAFRASRVEFGDLVAEGGSGRESTTISGGGCGVGISSIRATQEMGVIENTGRTLDVAIEGRGFFMVGDATAPSYSRAGNLAVNESGLLVNPNGETVLGFSGAAGATLGTLNVSAVDVAGQSTSALGVVGNLDSGSAITTVPNNPATFTELSTTADFMANLTAYDSLGGAHEVTVGFFKTAANTWTAQAYIDGGEVGGTAGVPVQLGGNAALEFGTDGRIAEANQGAASITAAPAYSGGAAAGSFTIDMKSFTQYAGSHQIASITQDGQGSGTIDGYDIQSDGKFFANLSNGQNILIGTLQLADFNNPEGLQRSGNGLYSGSSAAGEKRTGNPGEGGIGTIKGSSLERSTVDIANQFVDLVMYQRGYQASSQTLNAASTLLRDTLQLIR